MILKIKQQINAYKLNYCRYAQTRYYRTHAFQLDFLIKLKNNFPMNWGISEGTETSAQEHLTGRIWFCWVYFCSSIILKPILKKRGQNKVYKNIPGRSEFSTPRAFQWWSRICRSPFGLLGNLFFKCSYCRSNPAVHASLWTILQHTVTLLVEWSHPQPRTPIHVDNTTAVRTMNNTIKRRRSRATKMRYFWLIDQKNKRYSKVYCRPGAENMGNYPFKAHTQLSRNIT